MTPNGSQRWHRLRVNTAKTVLVIGALATIGLVNHARRAEQARTAPTPSPSVASSPRETAVITTLRPYDPSDDVPLPRHHSVQRSPTSTSPHPETSLPSLSADPHNVVIPGAFWQWPRLQWQSHWSGRLRCQSDAPCRCGQ